jgi:hypothetical protein
MNYAKTLFPTIILGAILPALTVTAYPEAELSKNLQAIWPIFPILLIILHRLLASLVHDSTPFDRFYRVKSDLPSIRSTIILAAFVTVALFRYLKATGTGPTIPSLQDLPDALGGILGCEIGGFIWMVLLFRDLKKARMIQTSWLVLLAGYVTLSSVLGSGASLLLAWLWREETLAKKRHWAAVTKAE